MPDQLRPDVLSCRGRRSVYATGEVVPFDLEADPLEQHNRADDPAFLPAFRDLDARLTQAVMAGVASAHFALRIGGAELSQSPESGREGWTRAYPHPVTA